MFTCLWQFWSWLDPPVTSPLTSPAVITMATLKKSPGSGTPTKKGQLRSPVIKRPLSSPVTLQGWLHKQGSDGLMLWKKRWFVLSEYCLFYYKGSEEEKLLGSILLPSYKISPCSTEDKVYRKFSFKAEHANMRTYYFAADSQQLMAQWMNALSLASILQESTTWEEHRSGLSTVSSQQNASADDSDSGFHGNFRPNTNENTLECTTPSNGWRGNQFPGYHQPLYANAPPKPRRLNNDTSSPERSPERPTEESGRLSRMAQPTEYQIRNDRPYHYNAQHSHRPPVLLPTTNQPQLNNTERRTPDTYGRSNSTTPQTGKVISSKSRPSDYEDVYQNNPDLILTGNHNPMYVTYTNHRNQPVQYRRREPPRDIPAAVDGQQRRFPPRPHSADFLEYDAKRYYQSPTPQSSDSGNQGAYYNGQRFVNAQPRRPKSSLDIMHNEVGCVDGHHWSEESYARKMRQSASYVSPQLHNLSNSSRATTPSVRQIPVMTPHNCYESTNGELASVKMREHSEAIRLQERRWSEYVDARANRPDQFVRSASARLPRQQRPDDRDDEGSDKSSQSTYKRRNSTDNRDGPNKSQQREESMKRLLEWKQRMLQSPLTRKSSGSSNRGVAQNEVSKYYKAQVLRELANQEAQARSRNLVNQHQIPPNINPNTAQWNRIPTNFDGEYWKKDSWETKDHPVPEHRTSRRKHSDESGSRTVRSRSQDGRRSASSINRYNSYSSDDEELEETRECRKRVRRSSQAGRSRVNSLEGKSASRSTSASKQLTAPDYENINIPENTSKSSKDRADFEKSGRTSVTEILPDSSYSSSYKFNLDTSKHESIKSRGRIQGEKTPQRKKIVENHSPLPVNTEKYSAFETDSIKTMFDDCNNIPINENVTYEDRFTMSSKHSDSGYDTLQTGSILPADPEVSDLLKFRFDKKRNPNPIVAYPVQTKIIKTPNDYEPWGSKLDETKLIKVFSYQYIKSGKEDGKSDDEERNEPPKLPLSKRFETPPENIVQSRIKVFEPGKEEENKISIPAKDNKLRMQEPLKMSPQMYQSNEAHVSPIRGVDINTSITPKKSPEEISNLKRSRRTSLHGFALGDAMSMLDEEAKYVKREIMTAGRNPKSVRDLLADFERKSQLAKEKLAAEERNNEDNSGKRYVFSDTETLLYDTSSDAEGNSDGSILPQRIQRSETLLSDDDIEDENEDEDRDEEVAAALGKRDTFFSSCRDLGHKVDSEVRKRKPYKSSSGDQTNDVEVVMTPGYLRLSLAESMVTHEDLESHCSSPHTKTPLHKKTSISDMAKRCSSPEEHYMPMTPSKKNVLAPVNDIFAHTRSNSASQTLIMENLLGEESSYVEMTQNGMIQSLLAPDSNSSCTVKKGLHRLNSSGSNPDAPRYCEIGNEKDGTHYEFLYKASTHTEPVYMEVSSLFEEKKSHEIDAKSELESSEQSADSKREEIDGSEQPTTPPRAALPDIVNASGPHKQASVKSDSSDADDEASKDLDSLDAPRHPRFSLSDTFRPASYYLGASISERTLIGLTSEHPDSSDSDLVSPPPIPTSPPPLDDLETSLESSVDLKKLSPIQIKSDTCKIDIESSDDGRRLWNPTPVHSKDMRSIHSRMERLIIAPNLDDTLSSETDSIDSAKRDQLLKRRPVSADILNSLRDPNFLHSSPSSSRRSGGSDLESIGSRNGLAMDLEEGESIDLDQYLEELQVGSDLNHSKSMKDLNYDYYRMYKQDKYMKTVPPPLLAKPEIPIGERMKYVVDQQPKTVISSSQELIYSNEHSHQSSNTSQSFNHTDEVHYENLHGLFPPPPSEELLQELSAPTNVTVLQEESQTRNTIIRTGEHQTVRSDDLNQQQAGAPYYYSDLLKMEAEANSAANRAIVAPRSVRMQQLNNQRDSVTFTEVNFLNKRNDIGRRVNAIHHLSSSDTLEDMDEASRLAEELRTTSVHFLGATDKSGQFDERNLYEADTLQRRKAMALMEQRSQSQPRDDRNSSRNLYPHGIRDKTESSTTSLSTINTPDTRQPRRRSRSLEGLLDEPEFFEPSEPRQNRVSPGNAISRLLQTTRPQNQTPRTSGTSMQNLTTNPRSSRTRAPPPPPDAWEEDALWRESLRRVSIRHTRSLDDLDIDSPRQNETSNQPQNRKVTREVTYVNDVVTNRLRQNQREYEEDYREGRPAPKTNRVSESDIDDGVHYERLVRDTETLERTRRGQTYLEGYVWDEEREMFHKGDKTALPSRDPPRKPSQPFLEVGLYPTRPPSFEIDREKLRQWDLMSSAPAGMLGAGRTGGAPSSTLHLKPPTTQSLADETVQRSMANTGENTPPSSPASGSGSVIGRDPLPPRQTQPVPIVDKPPPPTRSPTQQPPPPQVNNVIPITTSPTGNSDVTHKRGDGSWNLQVSAGELLGRTHEELVLLLIQLRRQSAGFCKAMEACHMEIEAQARLTELETPKRLEHLQKLEDLKRHLLELEKQYEKGKPLVNLVDNMVKLGSLYRAGAPIQGSGMPLFRERLEFNHKVQEQRLLAEERKDWERLSPDHTQLQAKVEQLYRLDKILQEESGTLQSLQQDKEMLERAIGGLRHKLQGIHGNPAEAERYRRQQRLLERELSRVRSILAHNSKKLEETVAENARLEQELVVLRQKLQWSRRVPDSGSGPTTAALEAELRRVQTLVGDLQRQRQELSLQVRQLTEKSHSLSEQIRPGPTGVAGAGPIPGKKSIASSWLETDLDTQLTQDVGLDSPAKSPPQIDPARSQSPSAPLYVNTDESKAMDVCSTYESSISQDEQQELLSAPPTPQQSQYCRPMDISEADDRMKRFYGIIPRDKPQEIKTVRIVKRESERRQRDRDRSGNIGIPLTNTTSAKRVTIIEESFNGDSSDRQGLLGRVLEEPPEPPSEVFRGSAPLIRPLGPPPAPGPRSDSAMVLRNIVTRQNKARLDSESSSPSRSISAHEQLFGSAASLGSVGSEGDGGLSPQLSPVYQSQAARQIVEEIAWRSGGKRLVPREKRRHHTVSGRPLLRIDTSYSASGSRDDLDMERALRPRLNAPDVVRSTLSRTDAKYTSETIDNILGTPGKIVIPERYVPESTPELTSEEQAKRLKKADAIRKMLSETTSNSFQRTDISITPVGTEIEEEEKSSTLRKKVAEEKRQREHLLQLNQILAQQVMEKSKMVAVRALATLPLESSNQSDDDDLSSPDEPLPIYQQRENYFS